MDPELKASLLWGVVGGLTFLVLVQGYELWTGRGIDVAVKAGIALVVAVGATAVTFLGYRRAGPKEQT